LEQDNAAARNDKGFPASLDSLVRRNAHIRAPKHWTNGTPVALNGYRAAKVAMPESMLRQEGAGVEHPARIAIGPAPFIVHRASQRRISGRWTRRRPIGSCSLPRPRSCRCQLF